jgi:hypothetical protein
MNNKEIEQIIYSTIRKEETDTKTDKDYSGITKVDLLTGLCIEYDLTTAEILTALGRLEDRKEIALSLIKLYKNNSCVGAVRVYNTKEYLGKDYFDINGMTEANEDKRGKITMNEERLKVLLYNALDMLKNAYNIDDTLVSVEDTDLLEELGMTQEEYDEILKGE